jgi:hypothetical protein
LLEPIYRVDLDAADPHLEMQVRTGRPSGYVTQANLLASAHHVPRFDQDLRIMSVSGIDSPTMIDNGDISVHHLRAGENHLAGRRRIQRGSNLAAEIQPTVVAVINTTI